MGMIVKSLLVSAGYVMAVSAGVYREDKTLFFLLSYTSLACGVAAAFISID